MPLFLSLFMKKKKRKTLSFQLNLYLNILLVRKKGIEYVISQSLSICYHRFAQFLLNYTALLYHCRNVFFFFSNSVRYKNERSFNLSSYLQKLLFFLIHGFFILQFLSRIAMSQRFPLYGFRIDILSCLFF